MQDAYFFLLIFLIIFGKNLYVDYENIVLPFSGSFYK